MTYIWHVALGSGEASREPCAYTDAQLAAWRGHIDKALAVASEPIPGHAGYALAARQIGGVLLCTVGRTDDQTALCTFAVVTRALHARKGWRAMHDGYPAFAASIDKVPQAPYCAVRAEAGLIYDQGAAAWLDAYQIAIAWAWIKFAIPHFSSCNMVQNHPY